MKKAMTTRKRNEGEAGAFTTGGVLAPHQMQTRPRTQWAETASKTSSSWVTLSTEDTSVWRLSLFLCASKPSKHTTRYQVSAMLTM